MEEKEYLVTDRWDKFRFCETKEEAEDEAKEILDCTDDTIYIFEVKCIGYAFIPDPDPVVKWK